MFAPLIWVLCATETQMNAVIKTSILVFTLAVATLTIGIVLMPSVTVENLTKFEVLEAEVHVPSSEMNFGPLGPGQKNTIYYSLGQSDGTYEYRFVFKNGFALQGSCGYVTGNEVRKRFEIKIKNGNEIICG